jgi:ubiquitin-like modifier-activating enzyme 5
MEEEQLQALLRDLDALKQRPDDPASIDRVTPSPAAPLPGSRQFASPSSFLPYLSHYRSLHL